MLFPSGGDPSPSNLLRAFALSPGGVGYVGGPEGAEVGRADEASWSPSPPVAESGGSSFFALHEVRIIYQLEPLLSYKSNHSANHCLYTLIAFLASRHPLTALCMCIYRIVGVHDCIMVICEPTCK